MADTVNDQIIVPAFQDLGVIEVGATISATVRDAAFELLKRGQDGLSAEQAISQACYHQLFLLTPGVYAYTLGTTGSLVATARPVRATGWTSSYLTFRNGGQMQSIEAMHEKVKDGIGTSSYVVSEVGADQNFPNINLRVWPPPSVASVFEVDYYSFIAPFAAVTDVTTGLPDGYVDMYRTMLAQMLYGQYARVAKQSLEWIAGQHQSAKSKVATKNAAILGIGQQAA